MKKEHLKTAGKMTSKQKHRQTRGDKILAAAKKKQDRMEMGLDFKGTRIYDHSIPAHWQPNIGHLGPKKLKGDSDSQRKKSKAAGNRRKGSGGKMLPTDVSKTMIRNLKRHNPEMGRSEILDYFS